MDRIRILCVEDMALIRSTLITFIERDTRMLVVAQAENGREAIEMALLHQPDVILMDLRMPVMDGIEATIAIRHKWPEARILLLTVIGGVDDIDRALKAGARGYLLKGCQPHELHAALLAIHEGKEHISPEVALKLADQRPLTLTDREHEVLKLLAANHSVDKMAEALCCSESTIRFHRVNLFRKLGVGDRAAAVAEAAKRGLIYFEP
ncbi:response regulator [Gloeobacter kilaueensis]|uniref:DNA-binding response regulator n=1 Tax=Gloeobacter kilaueensis (strain ATCC BAA-2537 / CCAP 1431/1 / ULC 316 / JS1) TaxID=1183438 RepID=U5QNV2_GLOK1|nr:response regulator transcription factor [Gloeobacter kilaueensis]AGY60568.1 DNA-binding response regulator [Gloeobacter kilaueensis JS1]